MSDNPNIEFLAELGRGAFGVVYLIKDKKYGDMYALKTVDLSRCGSEQRKKALEEADVMNELDHNHVVKMFKSYIEGQNLFLFTEYCEGGDLAEFLEDSKENLPEDIIVCWVWQMASALSHMHAKGILHRDLKPQNVYLTKEADIKLGDLGIARVLEQGTDVASTMAGTPCYMSPEIFSMKGYNAKTDIWSFGCVVYEIASRERAYDAPVIQFLMFQIVSGKTPSVHGEYSNEFKKLVGDMLRKNPDQRPSADKITQTPPVKQYASTMKRPADIIRSCGFKTLWGTDVFKSSRIQSITHMNFNPKDVTFPRHRGGEEQVPCRGESKTKKAGLQTIIGQKKEKKVVKKVPSYISPSSHLDSMKILRTFMSSIMDSVKQDTTLKSAETLTAQASGSDIDTMTPESSTTKEKEIDFLLKQIVRLQEYCARGIGGETLKKAYDIMSHVKNPADLQDNLVSLMGKDNFKMYGDKIMFLRLFELAFEKAMSVKCSS